MRIISGKFKGKNILFLKSTKTRPLRDFVKENIFNIISHSNQLKIEIKNSNILDLYSGIGSFGLECISRGAKKITFVEKDKEAAIMLDQNLKNLAIKNQVDLFNGSVENFLQKKQTEKFQIIFFDPPFAETNFIHELRIIKDKKIYRDNHLIIIHRETKSSENLSELMKTVIIKKYRRSKIIFGKF